MAQVHCRKTVSRRKTNNKRPLVSVLLTFHKQYSFSVHIKASIYSLNRCLNMIITLYFICQASLLTMYYENHHATIFMESQYSFHTAMSSCILMSLWLSRWWTYSWFCEMVSKRKKSLENYKNNHILVSLRNKLNVLFSVLSIYTLPNAKKKRGGGK